MNRKMLAAVSTVAVMAFWMVAPFAASSRALTAGAVYTMSNDSAANAVIIFTRDGNGILTLAGSIATGGQGSGTTLDPLGSQGSLVLSQNKRWLLAVNAGSNTISVFRILPTRLTLTDTVASGGGFPVSIAIFHNLVYVFNAGTSPDVYGFTLNHSGRLVPLADPTRTLGSGEFSQAGFDPEGRNLVVTDRSNNEILVYSVGNGGLLSTSPVISPSNGVAPFGFIFDPRGHLLVVEVGSGAALSSVSSYRILKDGSLQVISPSVGNGQSGSCWIAGNSRGDIYTSNTGSANVSSYKLQPGNGRLALLNGDAGSAGIPLDISIAGRFLYVLDPGAGAVDMFRIEHDGSLSDLGALAGGGDIPVFAQGIAAR